MTLACLLSLLLASSESTAQPLAPPPELAPEELVSKLKQGGYVIFIRHTRTDRSKNDDSNLDVTDCDTQRMLSDTGRDQALAIGSAIRRLRIPVGEVLSSEYCRCKDTAELAFGEYQTTRSLRSAGVGDVAAKRQLGDSLRKMLSSRPEGKRNTVLVSHTANLREAVNIVPRPEGVAYVFEPLTGGGTRVAGVIEPDAWAKLIDQPVADAQ